LALAAALVGAMSAVHAADPIVPCRIEVIDQDSHWPVPLVELRSVHKVHFVSDNAGVIALDLPEAMGQETWFDVRSPGYEAPADGFGNRGVRLTPQPGESLTLKVNRTSIAQRFGRLTGAGLFGESQKLGFEADWKESGVFGCDSVRSCMHNGRLFSIWGDTAVPRYPMGIFHATAAASDVPLKSLEPPLRYPYDYVVDDQRRPRAVAKMPGEGPTWLGGLASVPDDQGRRRLVAAYAKIKRPLEAYEFGLCQWNEEAKQFEQVRTVWTKSAKDEPEPVLPFDNALEVRDDRGAWLLFGNPLPVLRCRATYEAWKNPASWERLKPAESLASADGAAIKPQSGSVAWNAHRQRYVTVFVQSFGAPSFLGEVWYAEAPTPEGPWGPAVKILSHDDYSFYNPRIQPDMTPDDASCLVFEGTYTKTFSGAAQATPRYDYNQVLYRLELDDPRLDPARQVPAAPNPTAPEP